MTEAVRGALLGAAVAGCLALGACGSGDPTAPVPREPAAHAPSSGAVAGTAPTAALDAAEAAVEEGLAAYADVLTGAVVLVRSDEETRVLTSGWADRRRGRPVRAADLFPIASLTKPMVATAVLQYVDSGRISLDDPIGRHLPGVLRQGDRITVRHLLSHRSGLHWLTDEEFPPPYRAGDRKILEMSASYPLDFAPGTSGAYSNVGYTVLGLLLEELSGRPLKEVLDRQIFEPAGMRASTLGGRPSVLGHTVDGPSGDPGLDIFLAAGGGVSTADDYDRFLQTLLGGELLPQGLVDEMATATGTVPFGSGDYGLGLWLVHMPCGDAVGHNGAMEGFSTTAWALRDSARSVVVLTNDGDLHAVTDYLATQALCS